MEKTKKATIDSKRLFLGLEQNDRHPRKLTSRLDPTNDGLEEEFHFNYKMGPCQL